MYGKPIGYITFIPNQNNLSLALCNKHVLLCIEMISLTNEVEVEKI